MRPVWNSASVCLPYCVCCHACFDILAFVKQIRPFVDVFFVDCWVIAAIFVIGRGTGVPSSVCIPGIVLGIEFDSVLLRGTRQRQPRARLRGEVDKPWV